MLYLFTGTDEHRARAKAFAWIEAAHRKEPAAPYLRIEGRTLDERALEEITEGQGLFFSKILVLIDEPFATKATEELLLSNLARLEQSANPIALLAPKLTGTLEKKLAGHVHKIFREDAKEKKQARGFNMGLASALSARDSKKLWLELEKAKRAGDAAEALHGLLHWKARDMMQKGSRAWTNEEARALSVSLITLLADSRKNQLSLSESLEAFALSI